MQSGLDVRNIKDSKMRLEPVVKLVIDAVIDSGAQVYFLHHPLLTRHAHTPTWASLQGNFVDRLKVNLTIQDIINILVLIMRFLQRHCVIVFV